MLVVLTKCQTQLFYMLNIICSHWLWFQLFFIFTQYERLKRVHQWWLDIFLNTNIYTMPKVKLANIQTKLSKVDNKMKYFIQKNNHGDVFRKNGKQNFIMTTKKDKMMYVKHYWLTKSKEKLLQMKGVGYKIIEYTYRIITILHFRIIDEEFHNRTAYCIFLKFYAMVTLLHAWPPSNNELAFFLSSDLSPLSLETAKK